jgi:N utilization substance protein B
VSFDNSLKVCRTEIRVRLSENQESLTPGHTAKGNRRKGRELALQALYQIAITGDASAGAVDLAKEFARRLVSGVVSQTAELDQIIAECTENWKLPRLAKVDLEIIRIAAYELLFCPDIPTNVSLDEAIEIAKRFGSAESATFINGVLDHVAHSKTGKA